MALIDTANLTRDPNFTDRVTAAAVAAALQIFGEAPDQQHPTKTQKRQTLARAILDDPTGAVTRLTWAIAVNPTIQNSGTTNPNLDNDIAYVLTTVWDDIAGVTWEETN